MLLGKFVPSNFYVRSDLNLCYYSLQAGYQGFNHTQLVGREHNYGYFPSLQILLIAQILVAGEK